MNKNSTIISFLFNQTIKIRTEVINGEPWFIANDLCSVLGYSNPWDAFKRHVDPVDLVKREGENSRGQTVLMNWVNESGMYALIFGSKLESARKFKHWVTSEVLPKLRQQGFYQLNKPHHYDHLGSRTYPIVSKNCQKFMESVKLTEEQEALFKKCIDEAYIDGQMAVFDAKDNKNNFYITPELRKRLLNHFKYVCYAEKRMFSLASKLSRLNEEMQAVTRDLYYFGEAQNISHIMIKHALEKLK